MNVICLHFYFIFFLTQRCEHHEAHEPTDLLAHGVAGGGVSHVAGLEHGQGPAVHRHVLGGRQEVQDEVESRQRGHINDSGALMRKYSLDNEAYVSVYNACMSQLNSQRQCHVAHHWSE